MIVLAVQPGLAAAGGLLQMKLVASRFPGGHGLTVRVGDRRLTLGREWGYDASPACLAALSEFGRVLEPVC